jgi:Fe-S-cluster-containing hydrogenase component 2
VEFDSGKCRGCVRCSVETACPMSAVHFDGVAANIDEDRCFHCGLCTTACPSGAFRCNLGSIRLQSSEICADAIPVVLRQSDKLRALKLADALKNRILGGSFEMTMMVESINPHR